LIYWLLFYSLQLNPASPKSQVTTQGFLYPNYMIQGMPMPCVFVDLEFLTDPNLPIPTTVGNWVAMSQDQPSFPQYG